LTLQVSVPGSRDLSLEHLVLDVNGTLADRGEPIVAHLGAKLRRVESGDEKRGYVESLGAQECAAVGNGCNDGPMLRAAGLHAQALAAADVIALSIDEALGLLTDSKALTATLRP
jgi:hypothetical protein